MLETLISWLTRTLDASASVVATLLFTSAFSIGLLLGADSIESVLTDNHPIWAKLIQPVAWALLIACAGIVALRLWPIARAALSPTFRFRGMAGDVDALSQSLSNCH